MAFKSNEIKAGAVIIAGVAVLLIFLFALWGIKLGEKTHEYMIYFQYVGGISEGSLVKFRGIDVGWVEEILLPQGEEQRVGVKIEVNASTPIRTDSRAFITSIGLMRENHVEISAGSPQAELLPPGSVISSKEVMNFARMAEVIGEMSQEMQGLIIRVSDVFNDENRRRLSSMMNHLETMVNEGHQPLQKTLTNLETLSKQMDQLIVNLNGITSKTDQHMDSILVHLQSVTRNTDSLVSELRGTMGNMNTMVSTNQQEVQQIITNLQDVSRNLQEFTRQVKERPWMLIRKSAPPERKVK